MWKTEEASEYYGEETQEEEIAEQKEIYQKQIDSWKKFLSDLRRMDKIDLSFPNPFFFF